MASINPTVPQYEYITTENPYPAFVAGFGAGKTEAAILRSVLGALSNPENDRGFYEPTYDLIRMIAWPRFEEILTSMNVPYRLQKTPMNMITIDGGGKIFFRSMENAQRIVGYEHADADIDELDTLKRDDAAYAFRQIMARNRQRKANGKPNSIGVTTTPEGFKFVHETWVKNKRDGYEIIQAPTRSNPHLPTDYVDSLKSLYPAHLLDAYLEGRFVNLTSGTVYTSYNRDACESDETIRDGEPLFIGCDFNVTKQAATVYVQRKGGAEWHAVDELVNMYDTPDMVNIIHNRYPNHPIYMYPDASGKSRKTVDASKSDIALLEQAGFWVRVNKRNPLVKDRILAMNSALEQGRVRVNSKRCPTTADCLEQQVYKNGEPDKSSGNDHQNDATTYVIAYEMPIVKPVANVRFSFAV